MSATPETTLAFDSTIMTVELVDHGIARARMKVERIGEGESRAIIADLSRAAEHGKGRVIIDMTAVMLLLSAGIGAIITANKTCQAQKGRLVLYGLQPEIAQMLHLTGLPRILAIKDDEARALKAAK